MSNKNIGKKTTFKCFVWSCIYDNNRAISKVKSLCNWSFFPAFLQRRFVLSPGGLWTKRLKRKTSSPVGHRDLTLDNYDLDEWEPTQTSNTSDSAVCRFYYCTFAWLDWFFLRTFFHVPRSTSMSLLPPSISLTLLSFHSCTSCTSCLSHKNQDTLSLNRIWKGLYLKLRRPHKPLIVF